MIGIYFYLWTLWISRGNRMAHCRGPTALKTRTLSRSTRKNININMGEKFALSFNHELNNLRRNERESWTTKKECWCVLSEQEEMSRSVDGLGKKREPWMDFEKEHFTCRVNAGVRANGLPRRQRALSARMTRRKEEEEEEKKRHAERLLTRSPD